MHHDLRERLIEEAGTEPSEALRAVREGILDVPEEPPATAVAAERTRVDDLFVGRGAELDRLRAAVADVGDGRGAGLWVEGEPGIGKSALIAEGLHGAVRCGWGVGDELAQRMPLGVLLDCLDMVAPDEATRAAVARLRATAADSDPAVAADRAVAVVRAACARTPIVLVADDLHWADDVTLQVWRTLHQLTRHLPLLLVASCRPVPRNRALHLLRRLIVDQGAEPLPLGPLPDGDAAGLARRLGPGLPDARIAELVAEAAGNPYYLKHLVAAEPVAGELPPSLIAAIGAHLDRLTDDTQQLLRAVAFLTHPADLGLVVPPKVNISGVSATTTPRSAGFVAGAGGAGGCTVAEIAAVTGRGVHELLRATEEALDAGVLVAGSGRHLAFRHPGVRRVVHDGAPTALRVMLHRAFAEKIADAGGDPERVAAQLLAGPVPIDVWAGRWLAASAESLSARAPAVATALLRQATTGSALDAQTSLTLTAWLARLLFRQGRAADSEAGWVAARTAEPHLVAEMRWIIALTRHRRDEHVAAVDTILAALREDTVPEVWQQRYRLLLAWLTPYAAETTTGEPLSARPRPDGAEIGRFPVTR